MSGLLSKANAAEEANQSEPVEEEKKSDGGLLAAAASSSGGADTSTILTSVGWAVIVVGGLLSLQGGSWGLIVVITVLIVGIGALYAGQYMSEDGVNPLKMGGAALIAILLTSVPYGVGSLIGTADSFAVTELEYDENDNELTFKIRGGIGEATASIMNVSYTGEKTEQWTQTKEVGDNGVRFTASVVDFFSGNSETCINCVDSSLVGYELVVEGDNGVTEIIELDTEFMTREALHGAVQIRDHMTTTNSGTGSTGQTTTEINGLVLDLLVGVMVDDHEPLDGGVHSMSLGETDAGRLGIVTGDYTVEVTVKKGSSVKWTHPLISVDGTTALYNSGGEFRSGEMTSWISLGGTATGENNVLFLHEDDFYSGDGCYTFEIKITNQYYVSEPIVTESRMKWDLQFDRYNSAESNEEKQQSRAYLTC